MRHDWMPLAALIASLCLTAPCLSAPAIAQKPAGIEDATIASLSADLASGRTTSERAVRAYLKRIAALNHNGPRLNAILTLNPDALAQARALDAERRAGHVRGPLHGIPILLKDISKRRGCPLQPDRWRSLIMIRGAIPL